MSNQDSGMHLDDLIRATAEVTQYFEDLANTQVKTRQLAQDQADKQLAQWRGRVRTARLELEVSCSDGGGLLVWQEAPRDPVALWIRSASKAIDPRHPERGFYATDGIYCGCDAYHNDLPCWHRAAFLILRFWQKKLGEDAVQQELNKVREVRQYYMDHSPKPTPEQLAYWEAQGDELFN